MARRRNGKNTASASTRRTTIYRDELHKSIRRCLPNQGLALQVENGKVSWTPRILVTCAILWAWNASATLKDRFAEARLSTIDIYSSRRRPGQSYQGFISALCRCSEHLLEVVCQTLRQLVREIAADYWTVDGWTAFGVDGTKVECSITEANEKGFGRAGKEKCAPQQYLTMLLHLATGLPWAFERGPAKSSEREHLRQMIGLLPAESLVVADAGFTGYDLLRELTRAGHSFVIRVGNNVRLLSKLGYYAREFESLVYLWPQEKQGGRDSRGRRRKPAEEPLVLRLVTLHDGRQPVHLLTNVLDASRLSEKTMARAYELRWGLELYYRTLKQTMGKRKMLSDAPAQAGVELDWSVIGLWMLGVMMVEQSIAAGASPAQCSAASALRVIRTAVARMRRRCRRGAIAREMRGAVKDGYTRRGSKTARNYPRKKNQRPPGGPIIRTATETEVLLAQAFARRREEELLAA